MIRQESDHDRWNRDHFLAVGFELFDLAATFVAPNVFDLIISYPYDFVVEIRDAFLIRGDDG